MRYYKTPWHKKFIKRSCDSLSSLRTANKFVKNPVKTLINKIIDKGRNIDTKRKQKGYVTIKIENKYLILRQNVGL